MKSVLKEEFIIFYNVENLFLADMKPSFRGAPTATGLRGWNTWRYSNKLHKISHVFELAAAEHSQLPLLIGLSEVQGEKPLEALVRMPPLSGRYGILHFESMDERGIDTALLYNREKIKVLAAEPISFLFEISDNDPENYDRTRDILHCKLSYDGAMFHVFVCHLPSRRQKDINKPRRDYIVAALRRRVLELVKAGEPVMILGDFNANPDDELLTKMMYDDEGNQILENPFIEIYQNKKYSTFHFAEGLLFDQIFFSEHFTNQNHPLNYSSAEVFSPKEISSWDKKFSGRPFRTYAGTRYLGGYSDHFPVVASFSVNTQNKI